MSSEFTKLAKGGQKRTYQRCFGAAIAEENMRLSSGRGFVAKAVTI